VERKKGETTRRKIWGRMRREKERGKRIIVCQLCACDIRAEQRRVTEVYCLVGYNIRAEQRRVTEVYCLVDYNIRAEQRRVTEVYCLVGYNAV
jgi:hypothetical protein